jgi:hypothetical protein
MLHPPPHVRLGQTFPLSYARYAFRSVGERARWSVSPIFFFYFEARVEQDKVLVRVRVCLTELVSLQAAGR